MNIVEIDCLQAQARERTVKRAHQAARRGSARKGKEFRCYHRAGGTRAQAITHDALREIDLSRVDHARAGIMNGPVCFQHGPTIGTPPLVRADAQGQHMDAGSTQGARIMARIMICGHRGPLTRRKRRWLVGVMTLAFQGYAIATTAASSSAASPYQDDAKDYEVAPASRVRLA